MKKAFALLVACAPLWTVAKAQQDAVPNLGEVATTWAGIHYQIYHVEKIAGGRLLIGVKIYAAASAPPQGTFIGIPVPIPANATAQMRTSAAYRPDPVSLASATLVDEKTQQSYATVAPNPAGPQYLPNVIIATLHPNEGRFLTIQFPLPPPPPPTGAAPVRQTVSVLLPNASGPITHVLIPSGEAPTP